MDDLQERIQKSQEALNMSDQLSSPESISYAYKNLPHILKRSHSSFEMASPDSTRCDQHTGEFNQFPDVSERLSASCPALNAHAGVHTTRGGKQVDKKLFLNEIVRLSPRVINNYTLSAYKRNEECRRKSYSETPKSADVTTEFIELAYSGCIYQPKLFARSRLDNTGNYLPTSSGRPPNPIQCQASQCGTLCWGSARSSAQSSSEVTQHASAPNEGDWELDHTATEARRIRNKLNAILNCSADSELPAFDNEIGGRSLRGRRPMSGLSDSSFVKRRAVVTSQYYRYATKSSDKLAGECYRNVTKTPVDDLYANLSARAVRGGHNGGEALLRDTQNGTHQNQEINELLKHSNAKTGNNSCSTKGRFTKTCPSLDPAATSTPQKSGIRVSKTTKRPKFKARDDAKCLKTDKNAAPISEPNAGFTEIKFGQESAKKPGPGDAALLSSKKLRQYKINQAFRVLASLNSGSAHHGLCGDGGRHEKLPLHIYVPAAAKPLRPHHITLSQQLNFKQSSAL